MQYAIAANGYRARIPRSGTKSSRRRNAAAPQRAQRRAPKGARSAPPGLAPAKTALEDLQRRYDKESKARAEKMLSRVGERAGAAGVKFEAVAVSGDVPYEQIIETAKKRKCDLIMMASHGRRGLSGLLLGSETSKVLTHSKIPVLVVR